MRSQTTKYDKRLLLVLKIQHHSHQWIVVDETTPGICDIYRGKLSRQQTNWTNVASTENVSNNIFPTQELPQARCYTIQQHISKTRSHNSKAGRRRGRFTTEWCDLAGGQSLCFHAGSDCLYAVYPSRPPLHPLTDARSLETDRASASGKKAVSPLLLPIERTAKPDDTVDVAGLFENGWDGAAVAYTPDAAIPCPSSPSRDPPVTERFCAARFQVMARRHSKNARIQHYQNMWAYHLLSETKK